MALVVVFELELGSEVKAMDKIRAWFQTDQEWEWWFLFLN